MLGTGSALNSRQTLSSSLITQVKAPLERPRSRPWMDSSRKSPLTAERREKCVLIMLHSFAAWPNGPNDMTISADQQYVQALNGKPYMSVFPHLVDVLYKLTSI